MYLVLRRIFLFSIFILFLLGLSDFLFTKLLPRATYIKQYWVMNQVNHNYDYAVLGNSRTYSGFDVNYMEKISGMKGLNLSLDGSSYPEQYLLLQRYLRKSEIKYLILLADVYSLDNDFFSMPFHNYYYFPFINDSLTFSMMKEFYGWKSYLWKYIPFFRYAEYNDVIGIRTIIKSSFGGDTELDVNKGTFYNYKIINKKEAMARLDSIYPLRKIQTNKDNIRYFDKIIELAESKNIKTILINIPEHEIVKLQQVNRTEILEYFNEKSRQYSIPYINDELNIFSSEDSMFYNCTHLNSIGAQRVTQLFYKHFMSLNQ